MSFDVFDTDSLTLFQDGDVEITESVLNHDAHDLAITVLTIEEQVGGWYSLLRRAKSEQQLVFAYSRMADNVEALSDLRVLRCNAEAVRLSHNFRANKIRIGTMDLRIAATVISHGGILVTRNRRDFEQVPGLVMEDWSR